MHHLRLRLLKDKCTRRLTQMIRASAHAEDMRRFMGLNMRRFMGLNPRLETLNLGRLKDNGR